MTLNPSELFRTSAITGDSTEFLVGRREIITKAVNRLASSSDLSAAIVGARGVGKTTLAWQLISILLGRNKLFLKDDVLRFGKDRRFKVAVHRCQRSVKTVGDILLNLVLDRADLFSFGNQFVEALEKQDFLKSIETKFGINLFNVLRFEHTRTGNVKSPSQAAIEFLDSEELKRELFFDVKNQIMRTYDNPSIVIFLDELDRPTQLSGLGDFIKDINDIQFILVGIADNLETLVKDHKSAARKLSGGDIVTPLLTEEEIKEIFVLAIEKSQGRLEIANSFLDKAARYSGGLPYVAQSLGYHSVLMKVINSSPNQEVIKLEQDDFRPGMEEVLNIYSKDPDIQNKKLSLGRLSSTQESILRILLKSSNPWHEVELRRELEPKYRRFFSDAIEELTDDMKIINKSGDVFSIDEPEVRAFVGFFVDS